MAATMNTKRSSRGFTLIEMLVILTVMLAIAVASFPMMAEAIESSKLRGIVQGTVSLMRLARIQAIKTNGCGRLQVDATQRQVSGYLDQDCNAGTANRLLGALQLPAGVDVTSIFAGDVVFQGTGSADVDPDGDIEITFINRRGTAKKISVTRSTGKISVE